MNLSENSQALPLIHVGYPKCLSTWLQKKFFLAENGYHIALDTLRTQISIIDPPPFRFDKALVETFINEQQSAAPSSALIPVISAEALAGNMYCGGYNAQQNADRLAASFPQARILIIIREQRSLIRSLYKTQITWGMPHSITDLLAAPRTSLSPQFNLDYLKFDGLIEYYQKLYGKDQVLVLPYEMFNEQSSAFIAAINKHAGITQVANKTYPTQQRLNRNRPLIDIHVDRLRNRLIKTPFNLTGLIPDSEARLHQRIKRSKKRNRFPAFTHSWFEQRFAEKTQKLTADAFTESNRKTEALTGLSLTQYGYQ